MTLLQSVFNIKFAIRVHTGKANIEFTCEKNTEEHDVFFSFNFGSFK